MKLLFTFLVLASHTAWALLPATAAIDTKWQSVVFLKIPGPDADGDIVDGLCNGTLISADTLVTAAHCLAGSTLGRAGLMKLEIGEYQYRTRPDGTTYRTGYLSTTKHQTAITAKFVSGVSFNSPANQIPPENDFVFVHLNTPLTLPAEFIFASLWTQSISGITLISPLVVSVNPLEYISSNDTKQFAVLNQIKFSSYSAQSQSTSRVAQGDSGAPLFATINGKIYLIGVTKGRAETSFSNWDVFAIWGQRAAQ